MKKILIGGSPCTHWSIAQKNNRETTAEGIGWELFKNYLIAKEKFQPNFFLYENNKSAAQPIKDQISIELGVPLQYINSALVSAQNRQRFYAHNILEVPQPEDRGILLRDILESGEAYQEKSYCITATEWKGSSLEHNLQKHVRTQIAEPVRIGQVEGSKGSRAKDIFV
jgi:DNA (cytosine-5)-methyltransferase 3A